MTAQPVPLRPRQDRDYWRRACPKCDALHPTHTGSHDGCDDYRCWNCGHAWGMSA
jgi:hypothetical protein